MTRRPRPTAHSTARLLGEMIAADITLLQQNADRPELFNADRPELFNSKATPGMF